MHASNAFVLSGAMRRDRTSVASWQRRHASRCPDDGVTRGVRQPARERHQQHSAATAARGRETGRLTELTFRG